ncbi:MAG: efflux RND transporter periplasmic adaptor subunit [Pseudomonadales bacterium]
MGRLVLCATVCLMLLLGSGCSENGTEPRDIVTSPVKIGPLVDSVLATGRVQTVQSVDVSSQLSGRIDEVYVDFNDVVAEGDPLARLDQSRFLSRVEELKAALSVAQAELSSLDASLEGARARFEEDERDYKRKVELNGRGSVSDSEVSRARAIKLQSESALKTLAASREVKTATVGAAEASLRQAQIDLDRTLIRAPISGVVIKRSIEPGQTVAVSLSAPELFVIANDLREIEINAKVGEADIGKVRPDQPVRFSVDAYPGRRFDGTVRQIRKAPEISQNVVSYSVVIRAENPDELMLPGMTTLVEIETSRKDQVLQVPNAALRFEMPPESVSGDTQADDPAAQEAGVWLERGRGDFVRRSVEIGYSDGSFSEVISGDLAAGDDVAVGYRR